MVEPNYKDIGSCSAFSVVLDILWYQWIPRRYHNIILLSCNNTCL